MIVRRFLIPLGLLAGAAALVLSCRDATPVGVDARTSVLLAGRHAQPPAGDDSDDDGDEIEDGDSLASVATLEHRKDRLLHPIGRRPDRPSVRNA